jgi:hypothetical protein
MASRMLTLFLRPRSKHVAIVTASSSACPAPYCQKRKEYLLRSGKMRMCSISGQYCTPYFTHPCWQRVTVNQLIIFIRNSRSYRTNVLGELPTSGHQATTLTTSLRTGSHPSITLRASSTFPGRTQPSSTSASSLWVTFQVNSLPAFKHPVMK